MVKKAGMVCATFDLFYAWIVKWSKVRCLQHTPLMSRVPSQDTCMVGTACYLKRLFYLFK